MVSRKRVADRCWNFSHDAAGWRLGSKREQCFTPTLFDRCGVAEYSYSTLGNNALRVEIPALVEIGLSNFPPGDQSATQEQPSRFEASSTAKERGFVSRIGNRSYYSYLSAVEPGLNDRQHQGGCRGG